MGGGDVLGAGENSDSSSPTTPGFSGVSGASRALGASGGTDGRAAWLPAAPVGCVALDGKAGGLVEEGGGLDGGCGRLHAEKGGSGSGTGGNSDSGGPDDAVPDGDFSHAPAEAGKGASS